LNSFGLLTQGFLLALPGRAGFCRVDAGRFRRGCRRGCRQPWGERLPTAETGQPRVGRTA
jgi:hypothetical protein